ncbi:MAG: hypothetical protein WCG87_07125 [Bacteroidota bacterium]
MNNDIQQQAATLAPKGGTDSKILRFLANVVSVICHPVLLPTFMAFVLFKLDAASFAGLTAKQMNMWLLSIGITTLFFPVFSILLMKALGFIESIQLHTPKDRIIPLLAIMIFYFWVNHVLGNVPNVPLILHVLSLGCFWGVIVVFMVTIFFKVSMHTAGAGGMLGMMIVLLMHNTINMWIPLLVGIVIAGLIGTARMLLRAHTASEIWLGYILGIIVQVSAYLYLKP